MHRVSLYMMERTVESFGDSCAQQLIQLEERFKNTSLERGS